MLKNMLLYLLSKGIDWMSLFVYNLSNKPMSYSGFIYLPLPVLQDRTLNAHTDLFTFVRRIVMVSCTIQKLHPSRMEKKRQLEMDFLLKGIENNK